MNASQPIDARQKTVSEVMKMFESSLQELIKRKLTKAVKATKSMAYNSSAQTCHPNKKNLTLLGTSVGNELVKKKRGRKPKNANPQPQPKPKLAVEETDSPVNLHSDLDECDSLLR